MQQLTLKLTSNALTDYWQFQYTR